MRPALREAYLAIEKMFAEHEYTPVKKIKHFPNGKVRSVEYTRLTRELVIKTEGVLFNVIDAQDKRNEKTQLGFSSFLALPGSLSNSGFVEISV